MKTDKLKIRLMFMRGYEAAADGGDPSRLASADIVFDDNLRKAFEAGQAHCIKIVRQGYLFLEESLMLKKFPYKTEEENDGAAPLPIEGGSRNNPGEENVCGAGDCQPQGGDDAPPPA